MLVRVRVLAPYATDAIAAHFPVPALVHAHALLLTAGVGTRPRDTRAHTDQEDTLTAAVLLQGISTVPLAHGLGLPLDGETVCPLGVGLLATSVEVQGMAAVVAVAPGAIQSVPAARVHSALLVRGPGPAHVHVRHLTPLTRGTVEADLALGLPVEAEGVTVGMTSEIAGPGHQRNVQPRVMA